MSPQDDVYEMGGCNRKIFSWNELKGSRQNVGKKKNVLIAKICQPNVKGQTCVVGGRFYRSFRVCRLCGPL